MEEKPAASFIVGEPFPGPVPHREGAIMELWEIGLVVVTQFPGLRQRELEAFHQGFKAYSYLESSTPVPIAVWVFDPGGHLLSPTYGHLFFPHPLCHLAGMKKRRDTCIQVLIRHPGLKSDSWVGDFGVATGGGF